MVQPVIRGRSSTGTAGRGGGLLIPVTARVKGAHLVNPICRRRLSIGKLTRLDPPYDDRSLAVRVVSVGTYLVDKPLNGDSGGLFRRVRIKVGPVSTACFQSRHVEQVLHTDTQALEGPGIGEVSRVQPRRDGDGQRVQAQNGIRDVDKCTVGSLDRAGGERLRFVPIRPEHLGECDETVNLGEIWTRGDLPVRDGASMGHLPNPRQRVRA